MINILSLFSGIEGTTCNLPKDKFKVVAFSEIWAPAISVLKYNYTQVPNLGDITKIDEKSLSNIPKIDMITGGWPCSGNSYQGSRLGLDNVETKLFYEIVRLLKLIQPKYFLLENVKGLITVNGGKDYEIVQRELRDAGYEIDCELFNSVHFGTRQARERVFILGTRKDLEQVRLYRTLHDYEEPKQIKNKKIVAVSKSNRIDHLDARIREDGYINTLTKGIGGRGQSTCNYVVEGSKIRLLNTEECELLMTLPIEWTKFGLTPDLKIVEISEINRYKMLGNSIVANIPPHILKNIS
ncbi:MAG TPA: DNA (cytosine-5-)-methyltransferase [Patescibacteria group bacterium]|nr:DNA (cytosine-5-)-methyltransferase [Patescibacteria group bacterium]